MSSGQPIIQSSTITPGHGLSWTQDGIAQDAGPATGGVLTELGITKSGGIALGIDSDVTTNPFTQLGFGVSNGVATIYTNSYNGASIASLQFNINGQTYPYVPGNVASPTGVTNGDLVSYTGTTGGLIGDSGVSTGSVQNAITQVAANTSSITTINSEISALQGNVTTFSPSVVNIAALLAATTTSLPQSQCYVLGYYSVADGGEGEFIVKPGSTTANNGGTVIVDASGRRWFRSTLTMPWSVKWFGAIGNNSADDTSAIQNTMTYAAVAGRTVWIPSGTYKISSALTVPTASPLVIQGDGAGSTTILQTSTSANGIQYTNAASAFFTGGGVHGLTIATSLTAGVVGSSGTGLLIESANDVFSVSDVQIKGWGTGIQLKGCWNTRWNNITVLYNTSFGLLIGQDSSYPTTGGNLFTGVLLSNGGSSAGGTPNGVAIYQTGGEYFNNVEVDSYNVGWVIEPGSGQQAAYLFFSNCLGDTNTTIGWFFNGNTSPVISCVCVNCWASFNGAEGVLIQGAEVASVRWVSSRVRENAAAGIIIDGAFYTTINECEIAANGRGTTAGTYPGINITANTGEFLIQNNYIGNMGSSYSAQGSAVYVNNGTSTWFQITGNMCVNAAGGATPFYNGSSASSSTYVVANNLSP